MSAIDPLLRPAADAAPDATPVEARWRPLAVAWVVFWLLMVVTAVQREAMVGGDPAWQPLLNEGSSCLVTTLLVAASWRRLQRLDAWLDRPGRWFALALAPLPLVAPCFVATIYAIRHAVHAAVGSVYAHEAWGPLFVQESLRFTLFYMLFVAVLFGWRSHAQLAAARLRAEHALALQQRAQLLQLTQQVEPHFLFNALNTIAATVHEDASRADRLITRLAALLRAATDVARRPTGTLDEELSLLEAYVEIMAERYGDRVRVDWSIDPAARGARVPTLLLQPLLENAFRHGVERRPGPVRIAIEARRDGDRLHLSVADDAGQLDGDVDEGVGLSNLRHRLRALHGDAASLALRPRPRGGVEAVVELPWTA